MASLREFLDRHRRVFVLTGAGCSTESGIPDYRNLDGSWKRQQPVQFAAFKRDPEVRARYWARSLIGWRGMGSAAPNACHHALARLEESGKVSLLATQNVDGLHQAAGSRRVIDLHGRIDRVVCLSCRQGGRRDEWQRRLERLNAEWTALDAPSAPDGDADLDGVDFGRFEVPVCPSCQGTVKPDVVFFGESVPPWRHQQATAALETSDALLVVGSSLMVHSGYRYALAADRMAKPIAAVNLGVTRADALFTVKIEAPAGETLSAVAG
ncbi:MAG TPA: NAD-dependent protein deacetylase [Nocardioidaceae bacterium]|nr:NAD-dependent protein deacetylase [Nocardioidaceae bacterium]